MFKITIRYLVCIGTLLCLLVTLIYSQSGHVPETSVFAGQLLGISPIVWFVFLLIMVGFGLGFLRLDSDARSFNFALAIEFFGAFLLQILPNLKGYFFYGSSDPANHIGYIRSIDATGKISLLDAYPMLHIIGAMLAQLTGIDPLAITPFLQLTSLAIFFLGGRALVAKMFPARTAQRLSLLMLPSYLNLTSVDFRPQSLALALIPLAVYLCISTQSLETVVLLVPISFALVFAHPLVSLILISSVLCWALLKRDQRLVMKAILMFVPWLLWITTNLYLLTSIALLVGHFAFGYFSVNAQAIQVATSLGPVQALSIFARQTSLVSLLGIAELLLFVIYRHKRTFNAGIIVTFLVFSFLLFPATFVQKTIGLTYSRFIPYVGVAASPLAGTVVPVKFRSRSRRLLGGLLLLMVLLSTILTTYSSWYTYTESEQVTANMNTGYSFLFDHLSSHSAIGGPLFDSRYAWSMVEGVPSAIGLKLSLYPNFTYPFTPLQIGHHFDLTAIPSANELIVVTKIAQLTYQTTFNNTNTFDSSDFSRLSNSTNMDITYSSPDVSFYYVIPSVE